MNTSNSREVFVMFVLFVIAEINGFLLIRFGRRLPLPLSSKMERIGRLMCYSALLLPIGGLLMLVPY
jgi:hypothetical protein